MLEYDSNEVSKGIDVKKADGSRECIICHYWYFFKISFRFQPEGCNGCHDLMEKAMDFNVVVVTVKENNYRIRFLYMGENEVINLL